MGQEGGQLKSTESTVILELATDCAGIIYQVCETLGVPPKPTGSKEVEVPSNLESVGGRLKEVIGRLRILHVRLEDMKTFVNSI